MEGAFPDLGEAETGARAAGTATGDAGPTGDRAVEQKGVEDGALASAAGWAGHRWAPLLPQALRWAQVSPSRANRRCRQS